HRPGRRAAPRRRAGNPLLHAEPVSRDARDPDRTQDRPPGLIARLTLRLFRGLRNRHGAPSQGCDRTQLGISRATWRTIMNGQQMLKRDFVGDLTPREGRTQKAAALAAKQAAKSPVTLATLGAASLIAIACQLVAPMV